MTNQQNPNHIADVSKKVDTLPPLTLGEIDNQLKQYGDIGWGDDEYLKINVVTYTKLLQMAKDLILYREVLEWLAGIKKCEISYYGGVDPCGGHNCPKCRAKETLAERYR